MLQSRATAIYYHRIGRLMYTHANSYQLMGGGVGQSPSFWVSFRVLNPRFFSSTKPKVSYINKMDMSSVIHKTNAINIRTMCLSQMTSQTGNLFETYPRHLANIMFF